MKKCDTLDDLRSLGINAIHEHTHIARKQLEALLEGKFEGMSRVQAMGFISILEREYGTDLSLLRESYTIHSPHHQESQGDNSSPILRAPSKSRQKWMLGAMIGVMVLLIGAFAIQRSLSVEPSEEVMQLGSSVAAVVEPVENNQSILTEANVSAMETNVTLPAPTEMNLTKPSTPAKPSASFASSIKGSVAFKPKSKVWIGVMDLATGQKSQKVTKELIVVDTTKNSLYAFGHGRMEILMSDQNKTLRERGAVWFVYENGALTQLSEEQFKERNGGMGW